MPIIMDTTHASSEVNNPDLKSDLRSLWR